MITKFICPYWGSENKPVAQFLNDAISQGYDGVEINMPEDKSFISEFMDSLSAIRKSNRDFIFIAQQVLSSMDESVSAYSQRMVARLESLASLRPDFINSHTGKDFFSYEDNCRIIETAEGIADKTGIQVLHEIHRGRFTFHSSTLLPYLRQYPLLQLTADFSHWCTVSESMLQDQQEIIQQVIPHVRHIHARIGFEQGPQVNDPFAPEWGNHLKQFIAWWQQSFNHQKSINTSIFTITPEFGPAPYMPLKPYSMEPLSDQQLTNNKLKELLKAQLT